MPQRDTTACTQRVLGFQQNLELRKAKEQVFESRRNSYNLSLAIIGGAEQIQFSFHSGSQLPVSVLHYHTCSQEQTADRPQSETITTIQQTHIKPSKETHGHGSTRVLNTMIA